MSIRCRVERAGDMHPSRALKLCIQADGDVVVHITQDGITVGDVDTGAEGERSAQVEFCVSGGRSRHTHQALLNLIEAIKRDEAERPILR